jgi:hypothetical protein
VIIYVRHKCIMTKLIRLEHAKNCLRLIITLPHLFLYWKLEYCNRYSDKATDVRPRTPDLSWGPLSPLSNEESGILLRVEAARA